MTSRIRWRLAATYLAVVFFAMTILGLVLSYSVERHFVSEAESALSAHGILIGDLIAQEFDAQGKPQDLNVLLRDLAAEVQARIVVYDDHNLLLGDSRAGSPWETVPERAEGLRAGFGCRICHSEVKGSESLTVEVPLTHGGQRIGSIKLFASRYEAVLAAARTRRIILAALFITSLIVAAITMRLAASIADPVSHMNEMARKMASGDLSQRVKVSRRDEIGQLAESLNVMADRLQTNLDQLAQERDKMATVLTGMADGIVVTDRLGAVALLNRASERLFGLESDRVIGEPVEVLGSVPDVPDMIRRTLASGKPIHKELKTTVPAERIINVYAAPVRDQRGDIAGGVAVLQDVTEARRQAEIRKDFVANVSHELRTPVASIRAIVGALESGAMEDSAMATRFLDSLDAEAERLSLLLNDLLHLSELESGKKEPKRTTVNMYELAYEVVAELSEKAKRCGVRVTVDIPHHLSVFAEKQQMLQVLRNLIDNAVKYTGDLGSVNITGYETDAETVLSVRDTGVGIPPSDLDRIFERFYRVDKARSRQLGGTGLGLSIVKDIMDAYGGRVMAESQVGVGSTFSVVLPKHQAESDSAAG